MEQVGHTVCICTFRSDPEGAGKAGKDQGEGLLIVAHWPRAVWYPQMIKLLIRRPILLPRGKTLLQFEHSDAAHPLHRWLQLPAVILSGKLSRRKAFKAELVKSSALVGVHQQTVCFLSFLLEPVLCLKELWSPSSSCGTFLTKLFDEGLGYSAINTARSAISAVTLWVVGSHPQITWFLKGVFELQTVQFSSMQSLD